MQGSDVASKLSNEFQSAPGREAGRCAYAPPKLPHPYQFQSAPGREAGRCVARINAI